MKAIAEELGLTQSAVKEVVQMTLDHMIETLVDSRRVELRNFGVFEIKRRAARRARNPKTGESVDVAAKYVVAFRPGKEMEARVRRMEKKERLDAARRGETPAVERDGAAAPAPPPKPPAPRPPQAAARPPVRPDPPPGVTSVR